MIVVQILILGLWLLVIPTVVGGIFYSVDKTQSKLPFLWISGQLLLWASFQFISVPFILLEKEFSQLVKCFVLYTIILLGFSVFFLWLKRKSIKNQMSLTFKKQKNQMIYVFWAIFAVLLIFQLVRAVTMTYADGDDAYYIAVSTSTVDANKMYQKIPYTGSTTGLDVRHGLAPFPIWIAFLSKISGMVTVSVAHVVLPVVLITMTYVIFYLIGRKLFPKSKEGLPLFLIFTELLVLFGDYSIYTVENFMIARSRQGKAALGSIVIPTLFLVVLLLLEKLQESKKIGIGYWLLLTVVLTSSCLCSSFGAFLVCMFTAIVGICTTLCYKKWWLLLWVGVCCIPCVCFTLLYFVMST